MIKKIIALLLSAAMILTASAASAAESGREDFDAEAIDTLTGLGIAPQEWKDSFSDSKIMSGGEFALMLANIVGEDITDAAAAVNMLTSINVIEYEWNFDPSAQIKYEQAVKMLINLLGYNLMSQAGGGYAKTARDIKLLKNITVSEGQTVNSINAARMVFNSLDVDVMEYGAGAGHSVAVSEGENLLSKYKKIYKAEGQMTANRFSTLFDGENDSEDFIRVEDVSYLTDSTEFDGFLGYDVVIYYRQDAVEREAELVLASDRNTVLEINGKDVEEVSERIDSISYTEDKKSAKEKRIKINPAPAVIYNGVADSTYTAEDFTGDCTRLKFIDINRDSVYDVIYIDAYEEIAVNGVSAAELEIYNSFDYPGASEVLELENDGRSNYVNIVKDGEASGLSEIKPGDILLSAVSRSEKFKVINIFVSSQTVSGKLNSIDREENILTVEGIEYPLSETYNKASAAGCKKAPELNIGESYTFYLNAFGYVTAAKSSMINEYGYLFNVYQDEATELYYIKYLSSDGSWCRRELRETLRFNGEKTKDSICAQSLLDIDKNTVRQVIRLSTDPSGRIKELLTATVTEKPDERLLTTDGAVRTQRKYFTGPRVFQGEYFLEPGAVIFQVPNQAASEEAKNNQDNYMVLTSLSERNYNYQVYDSNEYKVAKLAVIYAESSGVMGDYLLVKDVVRTIDSDDMPATKVYGDYSGYLNMSFTGVNGSLDDVEQGDFIRLYFNAAGNVTGYETVYKVSTGNGYTGDHHGNWGSNGQWDTGIIESVDNESGYMLISLSDTSEYSIKVPSKVQIYDVKKGEFSEGTAADIRPGDYAVLRVAYYVVGTMVIYRF